MTDKSLLEAVAALELAISNSPQNFNVDDDGVLYQVIRQRSSLSTEMELDSEGIKQVHIFAKNAHRYLPLLLRYFRKVHTAFEVMGVTPDEIISSAPPTDNGP